MIHVDAIIIGTGQAGPPLAARIAAAGKTVAVIERHLFGGTCVNTGCMPTKTLVASAYAAHLARRGADFGVIFDKAPRIDMARVKARADTVVANARGGVEKWLRGLNGCTVIHGQARFEGPDRVRVGDDVIVAPQIFINVGGRAFVPPFPGIEQVSYLTNTSMLALDRVPEHLVVVGGSYVGLEFAQMYHRFGAQVTVVEKGPRLAPKEDEDISEAIREILVKEGITIRTTHGLRQSIVRPCAWADVVGGAPCGYRADVTGSRTARGRFTQRQRPERNRRHRRKSAYHCNANEVSTSPLTPVHLTTTHLANSRRRPQR